MSYMPDHEPALGSSNFPYLSEWCSGYNIAKDADLLFHDGQYRNEEYDRRVGWGHCSMEDAIEFGSLSNVKKMVLFHHDPVNKDLDLETMLHQSAQNKTFDYELSLARENEVFEIN